MVLLGSSLLKNWRPLTLQGYDSKILAKCIATRIKKVLPPLIHHDQTGFIEGRNISNSIRQLLEIIEHYDTEEKAGLADFEKAFDKVNWVFINSCLRYFGFGDSIITWIKVMYKGATSKVMNNGYLSKPITLERGVKQGCPLSPYLCIIAI